MECIGYTSLSQINDDRFGVISSLQLINNVWILVIRSISLYIASCDTPRILRSTWNESFSLERLFSRCSFPQLPKHCGFHLRVSLSLRSFSNHPAAVLLLIPSILEKYSWSLPCCWQSLVWSLLTVIEHCFSDAISWHRVANNKGRRDLFLLKLHPFFFCPGQKDPASWERFHLVLWCTFLGVDKSPPSISSLSSPGIQLSFPPVMR